MRKTRVTCETLSVLPLHKLTSCKGYITHCNVILNVCLELGMSVDYKPSRGQNTLLGNSVWGGRVRTVELLIRYGADVNAYQGFSLRCAAYDNDADMVRLLIKYGADVNLYGVDNTTAISPALSHASFSIVSQLLHAGAVIPCNALALSRNSQIDSELKVACVLVIMKTLYIKK